MSGDRPNSRVPVLLAVACMLVSILWLRERARRQEAEDAMRMGLSLAARAVTEAVDDELAAGVAAAAATMRAGRMHDAVRQLKALNEASGWDMAADVDAWRSASDFLAGIPLLREEFVETAELAAAAERDRRDASQVRGALARVLRAAADGDTERAREALASARSALESMPYRVATGQSRGGDGEPEETARRLLLETEHPARVAGELMTEGAPAVEKMRETAEYLLTNQRDPQGAVWAAEIAAILLGLRPTQRQPVDDPPPVAPDSVGDDVTVSVVEIARQPDVTEAKLSALLAVSVSLLEGRRAAGNGVYPADQLVPEARRHFDRRDLYEAWMLTQAALNVLGMNDQAIADWQAEGD